MPTLLCTGCSSGLGLHALLNLIRSQAEWRIILGARSGVVPPQLASTATSAKSHCKAVQLDLLDHASVSNFTHKAREELSNSKATHVLLCAGMNDATFHPVPPSPFSREAVVNHFAQRDILEALDDVIEPDARIIIVSSSLHSSAPSLSTLESLLKGETPAKDGLTRYKASKFIQLAYAYSYAQRHKQRTIVAVSPGFVPDTGLSRESGFLTRLMMRYVLSWMPFATSIEEGAQAISRAVSETPAEAGQLHYVDKTGKETDYDERIISDEAQSLAMLRQQ